jgi:hypothetical protein
MYDAMHAVFRGAVPEISKGSSAEGDEDHTTPKGLLLRRAALRISWLLVLVLRNTSAAPLDLMQSGDRMAVSRLVTEDDGLTSEQNPKFVCRVPAFTSCGPCLRVSHESSSSADQPDCRRVQTLFSKSRLEEKSSSAEGGRP